MIPEPFSQYPCFQNLVIMDNIVFATFKYYFMYLLKYNLFVVTGGF